MLSTRWQKLWLISALVLLFFPCIFVLMETPTEALIQERWSTAMLWKIQAEIPEYREIGVWYIRQQYRDFPDRELIGFLESRFSGIDFSVIRTKFTDQLENLRRNQFFVIVEAIGVYLSVVAILYVNLWLVASMFGKIRASVARPFK